MPPGEGQAAERGDQCGSMDRSSARARSVWPPQLFGCFCPLWTFPEAHSDPAGRPARAGRDPAAPAGLRTDQNKGKRGKSPH